MKEMINELRSHAIERYNDGGWDWIVECWGDKEMEEFIAAHPGKSIERLKKILSVIAKDYAERESEVMSSVW